MSNRDNISKSDRMLNGNTLVEKEKIIASLQKEIDLLQKQLKQQRSLKFLTRMALKKALEKTENLVPKPVKKIVVSFQNAAKKIQVKQKEKEIIRVLKSIKKKYPTAKYTFLYPPTVNWGVYHSRPHHLATALTEQDNLFFFHTRMPFDESKNQFSIKEVKPRLFVVQHAVYELYPQVFKNAVSYVSWTPSFEKVRNLKIPLIYDYIDELKVFYMYGPQMEIDHDYLIKNASVVGASARNLLEQTQQIRPDCIYVPNGVMIRDFEIDPKNPPDVPHDLQPILKDNKPIIGYFGALAKWVDYELIINLASIRKDLNFVYIGPDYDKSLHAHNLAGCTNIHILGKKDYTLLSHYIYYWDVAFIPFIINDITEATSPLKLFEYMAAQKPIVTTPMRECKQYQGVYTSEYKLNNPSFNAKSMSDAINEALKKKNSAEYKQLLLSQAMENDWSARAELILETLKKTITKCGFKTV